VNILTRRQWLSNAGMTVLASKATLLGMTRRRSPEWLMIVWCAHSVARAQELKVRFDQSYVKQMIRHCFDHGVRSILWRGSYVGKLTYPSRTGETMGQLEADHFARQGFAGKGWEQTLASFNSIAEVTSEFDSLKVALDEVHRLGMRLYADIALFDRFFPGLENRFFDEHPECWVLARDQKTYYRGIPCYAEPAAQNYVLSEIEELLACGVDGISLSLESHAGHLEVFGAGGKRPDEFGFNPPVVASYQRKHGIDIRKQPFESARLYAVNGQLFSDFLRRIHRVLNGRRLLVATTLDGYVGYGGVGGLQSGERTWRRRQPLDVMPAYRVDLEWDRWMAEGIADGLMVYAPVGEAIAQVQKIKKRLPEHPVYLIRETDSQKYQKDYRREFEKVSAGLLDGIVIDEMKDYHPHPQPWCRLLPADSLRSARARMASGQRTVECG